MEARSFFENSPMTEVTVSATPGEWVALFKYEHQPTIEIFKAALKRVGVDLD